MDKIPKTRAQLENIIRGEAMKFGVWPRDMQVLVYPLDGSWEAVIGFFDINGAGFHDQVLGLTVELRERYTLAE
jgi:hypothetical protein